jgi:hypothetical protein
LRRAEKLDRGYLGRILMLTLLAPDIVEAILDGLQPAERLAAWRHQLAAGCCRRWTTQS